MKSVIIVCNSNGMRNENKAKSGENMKAEENQRRKWHESNENNKIS